MSRTEKLYARLDECEREYLSLMREEFELLAAGTVSEGRSLVFPYLKPHDPLKFDRFVWLEKEIRGLREKLGEPVQGSIVAMIEQFQRRYSALGVNQKREIWIHWCKDTLVELNALANATTAQPRA